MKKNICVILFSNFKHIIEKQIQHLLTNQEKHEIVFTFYAICNENISSVVNTISPNKYSFISCCYHDIYKLIENNTNNSNDLYNKDLSMVIEIDKDCFIDFQYILDCLEHMTTNNYDIVGTQTTMTIIENSLILNRSKDKNPICKCITKSFLETINYNLYDFMNNDYRTLSHNFCILSGANVFTTLGQTVFCFDDICKHICKDVYKTIVHDDKKIKWINSILCDTTNILFNSYGIYTVKVSEDIKYFAEKILKS